MTSVSSHGAVVTIRNRTNTWTSRPSLLGTRSLTIEWSAVHTTASSPNTAKITIHNLSPKSQNAISDVVKRRITWTGPQLLELALAGASTAPAELVSTNAGIAAVNLEVSEGTNSWLWFVGNSSKISAEGQSLTLECADFVDQVGAAHVLPPRSFAKGTPVLDVVEAHINAMGLSVERPILEREFYAQYAKLGKVKVSSDKLISAITTSGPAVDWLRKLFGALKLTLAMNDQRALVKFRRHGRHLETAGRRADEHQMPNVARAMQPRGGMAGHKGAERKAGKAQWPASRLGLDQDRKSVV